MSVVLAILGAPVVAYATWLELRWLFEHPVETLRAVAVMVAVALAFMPPRTQSR